ncbi:MAG: proline--tRNA ligase [Candidatus Dasytiphilus stammeri]
MRTSQYILFTLKSTPKNTEIISHQLMLRAGLIRQIASGLYSWLPTGIRILRNMEQIVRNEMNKIGALEIYMPLVQPAELWQESGRWNQYGPELLRLVDRKSRNFVLGPTHEEIITALMRTELNSYKQLPLNLYQIQTKFRDEIRPRFGVMRSREFIMKDAYSFHMNQESLEEMYTIMYSTYTKILKKLNLHYRVVLADTGAIGGNISHEFQVLSKKNSQYLNQPNDVTGKSLNISSRDFIEVGHIFKLGTQYSSIMHATIKNKQGNYQLISMGCYGIGISRLIAAVIEQHHDENGIIWPTALAPFQVAILPINFHKSIHVKSIAEKIYHSLSVEGIETILHDRSDHIGVMLADIDLIGIPHIVIISDRHLKFQEVEYKKRNKEESILINTKSIVSFLTKKIQS